MVLPGGQWGGKFDGRPRGTAGAKRDGSIHTAGAEGPAPASLQGLLACVPGMGWSLEVKVLWRVGKVLRREDSAERSR